MFQARRLLGSVGCEFVGCVALNKILVNFFENYAIFKQSTRDNHFSADSKNFLMK